MTHVQRMVQVKTEKAHLARHGKDPLTVADQVICGAVNQIFT